MNVLMRKYGGAALVTGASGGLGAETARVLALRGAAVTLTARDRAKRANLVGVAGQPAVCTSARAGSNHQPARNRCDPHASHA